MQKSTNREETLFGRLTSKHSEPSDVRVYNHVDVRRRCCMKSWMREFAAILLTMALVYPAAYAQQQQAPAPPAKTPQPAQTQPQQSQTTPPADAAPAQDTTQTQDT